MTAQVGSGMPPSFEAQNSFNSGASARANNGGNKNPFSRAAQPALHAAWQAGWKAEEEAMKLERAK